MAAPANFPWSTICSQRGCVNVLENIFNGGLVMAVTVVAKADFRVIRITTLPLHCIGTCTSLGGTGNRAGSRLRNLLTSRTSDCWPPTCARPSSCTNQAVAVELAEAHRFMNNGLCVKGSTTGQTQLDYCGPSVERTDLHPPTKLLVGGILNSTVK